MSPNAIWSICKEAVSAWIDDFAPSMGAAIAYYTAFSLAPLLIIVIAIAGLVFGQDAASGYLYSELGGILGDDGAKAVEAMVKSASDTGQGWVATIIGVLLLILGATTVFGELQSDLDRVWKAPAVKAPEGVWGLIRSRLLSFGLVVSLGFVALVSLTVSAAIAALSGMWGTALESLGWLLAVLNFVVSFAVITVMFALMYKILPRATVRWHDVWIGSGVTALLFSVGKFLVALYVGKSGVASGFGAAGSLAVLLIWVYYSAQIFLLGAEFTWVYAHKYGSRREEQIIGSRVTEVLDKPRPVETKPAQTPPTGLPDWRYLATLTAAGLMVGAIVGGITRRSAPEPEGRTSLVRDLAALSRRASGKLR